MTNYPTDTPEMPATSPPDASEKARLLTLADLDGRTVAARCARRLIGEIESDLGGADRLSAAEREIAQRAAMAGAMLADLEARWLSGHPADLAQYATLANTQSRLLKLLGLERRQIDATPDLSRYIEERAVPPPPAPPVPPPPPVAAKGGTG